MAFLLTKADEFRRLSLQWPELANELRRMADECEELAAELSEDRRRGARA
ncbi:MAG: hypothetical protein JO058_22285 [Alphaproteobacteria bacterium]|nr:hypothetical protein [Alphaproteobacteria bacterium]MBV9154460.1 hypothetical protein [Alphaproteobacteria bacterium]